MGWLSSPVSRLRSHYEVAVVGSGYGGAIAAYRLAAAGRRVCVLERGRELQPGEYPDSPAGILRELQVDLPGRHLFSRSGLFDLRASGDISVLVGCGLGGTSLINASVAIEQPLAAFGPPWPRGLRAQGGTELTAGFRRAIAGLGVTAYPRRPLKRQALERWAQALGAPVRSGPARDAPLTATFATGHPDGDATSPCRHCGDCMTGCNYGAKRSLLTTYLKAAARRHRAELFTNVAVRTVEPRGDRWIVHYEFTDGGREHFGDPGLTLTADIVVLAAGTLGSTEILLRSRDRHALSLSRHLGHGFTGNGDVLAFGYNGERRVNAVGAGRRAPDPSDPVGACITGLITADGGGSPGLLLEEGAFPGALARLLPAAFATAALFGTTPVTRPAAITPEARSRVWRHLRPSEALGWSHVFLAMGHDTAEGRMSLERDRLRITWPRVKEQVILRSIDQRLRQICAAEGAAFMANPFGPVTVHPLGGCGMGDDAECGVVNDAGQVFSGQDGPETHANLYVCDGAIVPTPLGVNPLLTISALAERIAAIMIATRGWQLDPRPPS